MKAVVSSAFGESRVADVARPSPGPGEVLVAVSRVQLSVTECAIHRGQDINFRDVVADRFADGEVQVYGHEFCGEVVEAGDDVRSLAVGDRVYAPGKVTCDECGYCEAGYDGLCKDKQTIGLHRPGALAEYVALPESVLAPLPDGVTDREGAAMQPLASSVLCVLDADVGAGDVVAVVGTGVMGSQVAQVAQVLGAGDVFVSDVDATKLSLAGEHGLVPVDATEADLADAVADATDGVGADVVFEAVGGDQSHATDGGDPLADAYRTVRAGGTIVQVGLILGDVTVTPRKLRGKTVTWTNPRMGAVSTGPNVHTGDLAPELVADGRVSIDEYVTHELRGLDSFEEAVAITSNKPEHGALGPAQIVVQ